MEKFGRQGAEYAKGMMKQGITETLCSGHPLGAMLIYGEGIGNRQVDNLTVISKSTISIILLIPITF